MDEQIKYLEGKIFMLEVKISRIVSLEMQQDMGNQKSLHLLEIDMIKSIVNVLRN